MFISFINSHYWLKSEINVIAYTFWIAINTSRWHALLIGIYMTMRTCSLWKQLSIKRLLGTSHPYFCEENPCHIVTVEIFIAKLVLYVLIGFIKASSYERLLPTTQSTERSPPNRHRSPSNEIPLNSRSTASQNLIQVLYTHYTRVTRSVHIISFLWGLWYDYM